MTAQVPPTARQKAALDAIRQSIAGRGLAPTTREIAAAIGCASTSTVDRLLRGLEARGLIRRAFNMPRGVALVEPTSSVSDRCERLAHALNELCDGVDRLSEVRHLPDRALAAAKELEKRTMSVRAMLKKRGHP